MNRRALARPDGGVIAAFDGLRGALAWWVVLGHISHTIGLGEGRFGATLSALLRANLIAVDVFIILSGFVILRLLDLSRPALGAYLAQRAFRLFPLYLCVLALSVAALPMTQTALTMTPFATGRNALRLAQVESGVTNLGAHLLTHLPLLQGAVPHHLLPHTAYTLVGQAWSVSLEWQFYLLAPLCLIALRSGWRLGMLGAVLLGASALPGFESGFIGRAWPMFAVGMATYLWARDGGMWPGIGLALAAGAALALVSPRVGAGVILWGGVCLSVMGAGGLGWIAKGLSARALRTQGARSYSIYLVHMLPLYAVMWGAAALGVEPSGQAVALWIGTVAGTAALSVLTYRGIERPGIAMGRWLTSGSASAAASSVPATGASGVVPRP